MTKDLIYKATKPYSDDINDLIEDDIEKGRGPDKQQRAHRGDGPKQKPILTHEGLAAKKQADSAARKEKMSAIQEKNSRGSLKDSDKEKLHDEIKERDSKKPSIGERVDASYKKNQMKAKNHESGAKARSTDYLNHNNTPADKAIEKSDTELELLPSLYTSSEE